MNASSMMHQTAWQWLDYGEALLQGHDLFYGHGKDNAKDEAAVLIAYALGITAEHSEESLHQPLTEVEQKNLQQVFHKRIHERLPVAYITNEVYFAGFPFYIDQRAIIPRSPIAELIRGKFAAYFSEPNQLALLDLCCGSGCLGIASWLHCDFIEQVYLSDISKSALQLAKINAEKYNLLDEINIVEGDLFSSLMACKQPLCFDIILCNPPYVDVAEMNSLPTEYRHEPALALDGRKNAQSTQQDGLEIVDQIISECGEFLSIDGWLFLEVGASKVAFEEKYAHLYPIEIELESEAEGVYAIPASMLSAG